MKCPNCNIPLHERDDGLVYCSNCPFNYRPNEKTLDVLYAWISVDKKTGHEGLIAADIKGVSMPLINSSKETVMDFKSYVENVEIPNMRIELAEFRRVKTCSDGL